MAVTLDTSVDEKTETPSRDNVTPSIRPISFGNPNMDELYGHILGLDNESFDGIMPPASSYEPK